MPILLIQKCVVSILDTYRSCFSIFCSKLPRNIVTFIQLFVLGCKCSSSKTVHTYYKKGLMLCKIMCKCEVYQKNQNLNQI